MPRIPRPFLLYFSIFLALLPFSVLSAYAASRLLAPSNIQGESDPATGLPAGNTAPIAADDTFTINEDWSISVGAPGLLAGDFDPDGDPISVTQVTAPANGILNFYQPDGAFGYTPNPNFNGTDTFSYIITDGFLTDTAVVTMTVNPVNDFPVALHDVYTGAQDIPLSVSAPGILSNDSDFELDPLTAFLSTPPLTGTLLLNSNGSFDFTPPPGYTGVATFTYTASDNNGYALAFDGVDDYVDVGDTFENFTAATLEAWVYHTSLTGTFHEIYSKNAINSFSIHHGGGDLVHFNLGDGESWGTPVESLTPIPNNQWTHIAATWEGATGEVRLYINGQLDNVGINNIVVGDNGFSRAIGYKPGVPYSEAAFPGLLDEVRAWNIVRTQAEIQAGMYTHLTGAEPGLMHYFNLHNEVGNSFVFDLAASSYHFLMNMTPTTAWANAPFSYSDLTPVTLHILTPETGPDLTFPTLIALPDDVCQGEYFALIFAITNQGSLDAGAHQSLVYDDPDPTGFTHQTFSASIPGILAGQTRYFSLSANSFITGTRYLKVLADGTHVISETNELNNSAVIPLTVQPDPPPEGNVLINGGAITTTFPNLTLSLFASDTGNCATSPVEMRLAYDGLTLPWEPYTPTKQIVVLNTGEVTVSVQFKDEHNNTSLWVEATILVGDTRKIYMPAIFR